MFARFLSTVFLMMVIALVFPADCFADCPADIEIIDNVTPKTNLGEIVDSLGDVNSDGVPDFLVSTGIGGIVYVYSGLDTSVIHQFSGDPGDFFGWAISAVGDLTEDSICDFAISAPKSVLGNGTGAVTIFNGATGAPVLTVFGEERVPLFGGDIGGGVFGTQVSGMANGFVVSDPGFVDTLDNGSRLTGIGRVYAYSGSGALLWIMQGDTTSSSLGKHLAGFENRALVSQRNKPTIGGMTVFVVSGGAVDMAVTDTAIAAGGWGSVLRGIEDISGDGEPDFMVSKPFSQVFSPSFVGLYSGVDGSEIRKIIRDEIVAGFGFAISSAGDMDGDGVADQIIGAPSEVFGINGERGAVFIYSGADGHRLFFERGNDARDADRLGRAVAGIGDLNGDGIPDLLVGGFNKFPGGGTASGRLNVYYFRDDDQDGVQNNCDLCPGFPDSLDADGDGTPDGCDQCPGFHDGSDSDGDGVPNGCDKCQGFDDNLDADLDGVPDGCDICPGFDDTVNPDADSLPSGCDNCPTIANDDQIDIDGDGLGAACDPCDTNPTSCCCVPGDADGDGSFNISDVTFGIARIFTPGSPAPSCQDQADFDSDGFFNIADVTAGIARIFTPGSPAPVCGTMGI